MSNQITFEERNKMLDEIRKNCQALKISINSGCQGFRYSHKTKENKACGFKRLDCPNHVFENTFYLSKIKEEGEEKVGEDWILI